MAIEHFVILLHPNISERTFGPNLNSHESQSLYSYKIDMAEVKLRISGREIRSSYRSVEPLIEHIRSSANI
jgi:hypothetical protein